jgi:SAM-dependent methyltransferase
MIRAYYDGVWAKKLALPHYQTLDARWRSRWDFAVQRIAPGSRVLDIACGDGVLGEMLVRDRGCHVLGLEVSGYARDVAARRGLTALACDIAQDRFPVADADFDYVTALCCLEHIFDPGHALREAARALKPGGRILVTLPNAVSLRFRLAMLGGKLSKDLLHQNDGEGLHIRFFDYEGDFERLVAQAAPSLRLAEKIPALKNPRKHGAIVRRLLERAVRARPNLFAEYSHYVLEHRTG